MSSRGSARSGLRAGVVATVSAALPLCLASCASSTQAELSAYASELQAATDSDLLVAPEVRRYEMTEVEIDAPRLPVAAAERLQSATPAGYLVLDDGIITEASLSLVFEDETGATFTLTEPASLHLADGEDQSVYAVGTLTVGDLEQPEAGLRLLPGEIGDEAAEFDVSFDLPEEWRAAAGAELDAEVSAHIEFVAR